MNNPSRCELCEWYGVKCRNAEGKYYGIPLYPDDTCPDFTRYVPLRVKYENYRKEKKNENN